MLRASRAPKEYIEAAKHYRCEVCERVQPPRPTHKVALPRPYVFGREVGVDVFEVKDAAGTFYEILHCVCSGTTFAQAWIVREGTSNGPPSSAACLEAFDKGWVRPYMWPKYVTVDRGVHNRGIFARTLARKGVIFRPAGLESPNNSDESNEGTRPLRQ